MFTFQTEMKKMFQVDLNTLFEPVSQEIKTPWN